MVQYGTREGWKIRWRTKDQVRARSDSRSEGRSEGRSEREIQNLEVRRRARDGDWLAATHEPQCLSVPPRRRDRGVARARAPP